MTCAVYIPTTAPILPSDENKFGYVMYLSGLTCTDENVCQKGAPFAHLFKHQVRKSSV